MRYIDVITQLTSNTIDVGLNPTKRRYWPRFAFHFTDILNAVSILNSGFLVSRDYAASHHIMINDNASDSVISGTKDLVEQMVRFYFRPRTPTQFYNEGFQTSYSREQRKLTANCPVPVFLLFSLPELLNLPDTRFSDRTLARNENVELMSSPEEFSQLPFRYIYHDTSMMGLSPEQRRDVTGHKHAEIVIPEKVDLNLLRQILVRSTAEKTTLLTLLHDCGNYQFDDYIQLGDESTFYMDRNFVRDVSMSSTEFSIQNRVKNPYPSDWGVTNANEPKYAVNPDARDRYLNVTIKSITPDGRVVNWPRDGHKALFKEQMSFRLRKPEPIYTLEVMVDNHVAYKGQYNSIDDELPF
ncbi:DarT ssDNA thymidine ADP-ribosyltransferase family protein [Levilactobacillus enshiensis]|uniref:DarT ssDNA thymidine ADP-ribosyltransferase family protein n=1 Tax=Levilactobacillus enshiensis TaxID=2590213 RepID=UPI00117B408A|nr:DarT ssDNA thymidine ADP-ribosyltransferase family protein [Levilactobacillus enshiensis]